jgi:transposase
LHTKTLLKQLLKVDKITIENAYFESNKDEEILVVKVRPFTREKSRCPHCKKCCKGYDSSNKIRRWRSLDFGRHRVYIESCAPRVSCPVHGVIVAHVPWAKHDSDYTHDFETAVTWLTLHTTAVDVSEYFRIDWHTVGSIAKRVQKSLEDNMSNRFDGLENIGIDETSYKKGHKYMTVVVNHKTGALIWAHKGHGKKIKRHQAGIINSFKYRLTNARIEAINNKIKVTIRMGYGFRNIDNLIALVRLQCGGFNVQLPGRKVACFSYS